MPEGGAARAGRPSAPKSRIRPLQGDDLDAVVALYEAEMLSGSRTPRPGMREHFERLFLTGRWCDPEVPALVYQTQDGRVGGFVGSTVRRMVYRGQAARMACPGPLFTEPDLRPAAGLLMRSYFSGPQDVTMSDRHSLAAQRLLVALGAEVMHLHCLRWTRVFRPAAFKGNHLALLGGMARFERAIGLVAGALDTALAAVRRAPTGGTGGPVGEELTPGALMRHYPDLTRSLELYPDYDEPYLGSLLADMAKLGSQKGELTAVLVRDGERRVKGWYVYFLKRGGISEVFQLAAVEGGERVVLDHLFAHAERSGASALRGRLEPRLREPLRDMRCLYIQQACMLLHARRPGIREAVASGKALLSLMDGEVWVNETLPQ